MPCGEKLQMTVQNTAASENPEKRLAILEQAIHTFAEDGFRGTDVQVIADRAGVGKGTVYRYFGNKEDLFWATTFEVMRRLDQQLFTSMDGVEGALAKLRASCRAFAVFFEEAPLCLEVFVQDRAEFRGAVPKSHIDHHEKMINEFASIVQQGIADGELRPVDVRKTVIALGGVLYGSAIYSCYTKDLTLTEITQHAVDTFLNGIRNV